MEIAPFTIKCPVCGQGLTVTDCKTLPLPGSVTPRFYVVCDHCDAEVSGKNENGNVTITEVVTEEDREI